jgi:hypothetical protein
MPDRDYSRFVKELHPKEDDRPFWLRLLLSIKPSFSFSAKKIPSSAGDAIDGIKFKIKGGADF